MNSLQSNGKTKCENLKRGPVASPKNGGSRRPPRSPPLISTRECVIFSEQICDFEGKKSWQLQNGMCEVRKNTDDFYYSEVPAKSIFPVLKMTDDHFYASLNFSKFRQIYDDRHKISEWSSKLAAYFKAVAVIFLGQTVLPEKYLPSRKPPQSELRWEESCAYTRCSPAFEQLHWPAENTGETCCTFLIRRHNRDFVFGRQQAGLGQCPTFARRAPESLAARVLAGVVGHPGGTREDEQRPVWCFHRHLLDVPAIAVCDEYEMLKLNES